MTIDANGPIGPKILAALNLPSNTSTILIRFEPMDLVKIEATIYPSREDLVALGNVFAKIEKPAPPQGSVKSEGQP